VVGGSRLKGKLWYIGYGKIRLGGTKESITGFVAAAASLELHSW
jgi:hypothetical protein